MLAGKPWRKGLESKLGRAVLYDVPMLPGRPRIPCAFGVAVGAQHGLAVSLPRGMFPGKTPVGTHSGNAVPGGPCPPSISRGGLSIRMGPQPLEEGEGLGLGEQGGRPTPSHGQWSQRAPGRLLPGTPALDCPLITSSRGFGHTLGMWVTSPPRSSEGARRPRLGQAWASRVC